MKKAAKNRSGKTIEQLAFSIFGRRKANEILNTSLTARELKEIEQDSIYSTEEKADDAAIKANLKKLFKAELTKK